MKDEQVRDLRSYEITKQELGTLLNISYARSLAKSLNAKADCQLFNFKVRLWSLTSGKST